jgi:predicted nucleic acid-binding Zn ribbon protein
VGSFNDHKPKSPSDPSQTSRENTVEVYDPNLTDDQKKSRKLTQSAEVLQSLLQNSKQPISRQFLRWRLWSKWPEVVGPTVSAHCYPVGFAEGTLFLFVKSSAWVQELTFMSRQIQGKVNAFVGLEYVKQIKFTTDAHAVPKPGGNVGNNDIARILGESLTQSKAKKR